MKSRFPTLRNVLAAVALTALPFAGCATTKPMHASTSVPASEGSVRTTDGADGNTDVTIWVKHLATPSRVQADATTYVVWFQPRGGDVQNVGAMTVDDNLDGRFDGSTAHRRFQVSVTPEPNSEVAHPSHPAVFTSDVDLGEPKP